MNKPTLIAFVLLIVVAAVSRLMVFGIAGFAPQMAMALFGGAVIKDKKWALALPLLSLLLSDILMEVLFRAGAVDREGFYKGQWAVYLCFALLTAYGFLMKKINVKNIFLFSVSGSVLFFLLSNFFVWIGGGGFDRPLTFDGLLLCYWDALLYYRDNGLIKGFLANAVLGELIWSAALFGGYYLLNKVSFPAKREVIRL
ncbi:MAG: DUF6580 family putative transport protein [Chitinophagaceae bacterium]